MQIYSNYTQIHIKSPLEHVALDSTLLSFPVVEAHFPSTLLSAVFGISNKPSKLFTSKQFLLMSWYIQLKKEILQILVEEQAN